MCRCMWQSGAHGPQAEAPAPRPPAAHSLALYSQLPSPPSSHIRSIRCSAREVRCRAPRRRWRGSLHGRWQPTTTASWWRWASRTERCGPRPSATCPPALLAGKTRVCWRPNTTRPARPAAARPGVGVGHAHSAVLAAAHPGGGVRAAARIPLAPPHGRCRGLRGAAAAAGGWPDGAAGHGRRGRLRAVSGGRCPASAVGPAKGSGLSHVRTYSRHQGHYILGLCVHCAAIRS
jgi:hypothetical protein